MIDNTTELGARKDLGPAASGYSFRKGTRKGFEANRQPRFLLYIVINLAIKTAKT